MSSETIIHARRQEVFGETFCGVGSEAVAAVYCKNSSDVDLITCSQCLSIMEEPDQQPPVSNIFITPEQQTVVKRALKNYCDVLGFGRQKTAAVLLKYAKASNRVKPSDFQSLLDDLQWDGIERVPRLLEEHFPMPSLAKFVGMDKGPDEAPIVKGSYITPEQQDVLRKRMAEVAETHGRGSVARVLSKYATHSAKVWASQFVELMADLSVLSTTAEPRPHEADEDDEQDVRDFEPRCTPAHASCEIILAGYRYVVALAPVDLRDLFKDKITSVLEEPGDDFGNEVGNARDTDVNGFIEVTPTENQSYATPLLLNTDRFEWVEPSFNNQTNIRLVSGREVLVTQSYETVIDQIGAARLK